MSTDSLIFEIDPTPAEAGSKRVVKSFQDIQRAADGLSSDVVTKANAMAKALNALSQVGSIKSGVVSSIQALNEALRGFKAPSQTAIDNMNSFLRVLSRLEISPSSVRGIKSISDAFAVFAAPSKASVDNVERLLMLFQTQPNVNGMLDIAAGLELIARNATQASTALHGMLGNLRAVNEATGRNGLGITPIGGYIREASRQGVSPSANSAQAENASSEARNRNLERERDRTRDLAAAHGTLTGAIFNTKAAFDALMSILGAKVIIDRIVDFQKMELTLDAVSTSTHTASTNMDFLARTSKNLGLEIITTGEGYAKMLASIEGSRVTVGDAQGIFAGMSIAMRALHLTSADTHRAFVALSQIISKNQIQSEELKGQLGDVLPGALTMMASGLKVTTVELQRMMKQGELTGEKMREALIGFVTVYVDKYAPNLLLSLSGLQAGFARLQNQFTETVVYMGKNGLEDSLVAVTTAIGNLLTLLRDSGALKTFAEAIRGISQNLSTLGYAIAGIGAAKGLTSIIGAFSQLKGISGVFGSAMSVNISPLVKALGSVAGYLTTFPALLATSGSAWSKFFEIAKLAGEGFLAVLTAIARNPIILIASITAMVAAWALFNKGSEEATAAANKHQIAMDSLKASYDNAKDAAQQYNFTQDLVAKRILTTQYGVVADIEAKVKTAENQLKSITERLQSSGPRTNVNASSEYREAFQRLKELDDELVRNKEILSQVGQEVQIQQRKKLVDPLVQINQLSFDKQELVRADEEFKKITASAKDLITVGDKVKEGIFSQGIIQRFLSGTMSYSDSIKLLELADKMVEIKNRLFAPGPEEGQHKLSYFEEQKNSLEKQLDTLLQVEDAYTAYYTKIANGTKKLTIGQAEYLGSLAETNKVLKEYTKDSKTVQDMIEKSRSKTVDPIFEPLLKYDQAVEKQKKGEDVLKQTLESGNLPMEKRTELTAKLIELQSQMGSVEEGRTNILKNLNIEENKYLKSLQEKVNASDLDLQKSLAGLDITGQAAEALDALTASTKIHNLELERANELEKANQALVAAKAANGGAGDTDAIVAIQNRIEAINKSYGQMISNEDTQRQIANLKKLSDFLKDIYSEMKSGVQDFFEALLTGSEVTFTNIGTMIKTKIIKALSAELATSSLNLIGSLFSGSSGTGGSSSGILGSLSSLFTNGGSLSSGSGSNGGGGSTSSGGLLSQTPGNLISSVGSWFSNSTVGNWLGLGSSAATTASATGSIAGISLPSLGGVSGVELPALANGGVAASSLGEIFGGAGIGMGIGGLFNSFTGGNAQNGGIGGLAGSVVGGGVGLGMGTILGFAGGPAGALVGGLLGSVLGGLFGDSHAESDKRAIEKQNKILQLQPELDKFYTDYANQLSEAGQKIQALTDRFQSLSQKAKALGQDTALLEDTYTKAKKAITDAFNSDVQVQIDNYTNPALAKYTALVKKQNDLVKEGIEAEGDLSKVRELNVLQMKDLLDSLTNAQLKLLGVLQNAADEAYRQVDLLTTQIADLSNSVTSSIDDQIAATNASMNSASNAAQTYRDFAKTLKETVQSLLTGSLTTLNPLQVYQTQGSNFDTIAAQAAAGNTDALSKLPQAAQDFLSSSRSYNASSVPYATDFNKVINTLTNLGISSDVLATATESSNDILKAEVKILEAIKANLSSDSPNAQLMTKQLEALGAINGVLNGTQSLTSTQLLQMAGITEGDMTIAQTITKGNNDIVNALNQMVALQAQLVTAKQKADAVAAAEKAYNAQIDAKVSSFSKVTSGLMGQVGNIAAVSPQANESSSQKRYNSGGTLLLSAGDRPSAQSEQRANALGGILVGLTKQIMQLTGATGGADFQINLSSKYGSGYAIMGGADKQSAFSINDYNGIISSFVMDWTKTLKGVPSDIMDILSKQSWGNVQTALTAAALEIYKKQQPFQAPDLNQYAVGTDYAAKGLALVGEHGPELVNFRGGESVLPTRDTMSMLGGATDSSFSRGSSRSTEETLDKGFAYLSGMVKSLIGVVKETQDQHAEQLSELNMKVKTLNNKLALANSAQDAKGSKK